MNIYLRKLSQVRRKNVLFSQATYESQNFINNVETSALSHFIFLTCMPSAKIIITQSELLADLYSCVFTQIHSCSYSKIQQTPHFDCSYFFERRHVSQQGEVLWYKRSQNICHKIVSFVGCFKENFIFSSSLGLLLYHRIRVLPKIQILLFKRFPSGLEWYFSYRRLTR